MINHVANWWLPVPALCKFPSYIEFDVERVRRPFTICISYNQVATRRNHALIATILCLFIRIKKYSVITLSIFFKIRCRSLCDIWWPLTGRFTAKLWCFLCCWPEQAVEQAVYTHSRSCHTSVMMLVLSRDLIVSYFTDILALQELFE